jgi:hydrogenase/urease accessory protein HupE
MRNVFWVVLLFVVFCSVAQAHDPGLSSVEMQLKKNCLEARITFAVRDIEPWLPRGWSGNRELSVRELAFPQWERIAFNALQIDLDGRKTTPVLEGARSDAGAIQFALRYSGQAESQLTVRSLILPSLPFGHRQFFSLKDRDGNILSEHMLAAKANVFTLDLAASRSRWLSGWQFVVLGVKHILTGYDHLLFLLALLLAGGSLIEVSKIVTSFTAAHSITLALATLNFVQIPSGVIEPLIAASIVYVGVENILGANLKRRWLLSFAFGLIHGFGFSSALRQLGIGAAGTGIWVPLSSFNIGVELGQGAIVLLVLPLIWQLRKRPAFVFRYVPSCSLLVTLAGAFWLIQRILLA